MCATRIAYVFFFKYSRKVTKKTLYLQYKILIYRLIDVEYKCFTYVLPGANKKRCNRFGYNVFRGFSSGTPRNRTRDTRIFSPLLYQLS